MPAIGSVRLGSLFLTLPTRALTRQQIISSRGQGASSALRHVRRLFTEPSRPCIGLEHRGHAVVELGAQFVVTKLPIRSPAGER
jgi:hypothetical protein